MIEYLLEQSKNKDTILKIIDSMISKKDYSNNSSLISRHTSNIIPNIDNLMQYKSDRSSGLTPVKDGQPYIGESYESLGRL